MILDPPVIQHVAANLVAPGNFAPVTVKALHLLVALGLFEGLDLGLQDRQGHPLVLLLAALVHAFDDDVRRYVADTNGGGHLVDVLAARAAGPPEEHDVQFFLPQFNIEVFQDGQHVHSREAGVPPLVGVERADAHQAVNAPLARQVAHGIVAAHLQGDAADAGLLAVGAGQFLYLVVVLLEVAEVHAKEHLRPVAGLRAAGPGLDAEEAVAGVVLAGQQRHQLDALQLLLNHAQFLVQLLERRGVVGLLGQFEQGRRILVPGQQRLDRLDQTLEGLQFAHHLAGPLRDIPETGLGHDFFKFGEPPDLAGQVKESPVS